MLAITFSSLFVMIAHGHADPSTVKKEKKSGDWTSPQLDPAVMAAAAEAPRPTLFGSTVLTRNAFNTPPATSEHTRYPWKEKIVTTTFWIGELPTENNPVPNTVSSWDKNWVANYGGSDTPLRSGRKDFIPATFTPRLNPFYVALPYNDMEKTGFKAEASKVVPWFKSAYQGPMQSVCKDRWVAIRYGSKIVYAQWEDCGPFRTDHWEYVFGDERPKPNLNHGAGLDVSPAVRDYLGMNDTDVTDWRFVESSEVPPGPWTKYGGNNPFVTDQRKQTERLAQAKQQELEQLREARDREFGQNGYQ